MKRIFTIISFLAVTFSAMAGIGPSRLSVTSMYNAPIHVRVDGRWIKDYNGDIHMSNLNPGFHRVQIYSVKYKRGIFGNRKSKEKLIYNGRVKIRSGMNTTMTVQRNGRVNTDDRPMENRRDYDRRNDRNRRGRG